MTKSLWLAFLLMASTALGQEAFVTSIHDVEKHLSSGRIKSVDDVLDLLLPETKRHPVPVYSGQSSQPSSCTRPRLLYAESNSMFYTAVSTAETQRKYYNMIEFAQVDAQTGEPDFYLLDFNQTNPRPVKNPPECMICHLINGRRRLRIEGYPYWTGWFGGSLQPGAELLKPDEEAKAKEFLQALGEIHRLQGYSWSDVTQFLRDANDSIRRMNILVMTANNVGLFSRLQSFPGYEEMKLALAASMETSSIDTISDFLPPQEREIFARDKVKLDAELKEQELLGGAYINSEFKRINGVELKPFPGRTNFQIFIPEENGTPKFTLLEWFLRKNGESLANYSTSYFAPTFAVNDGVRGQVNDLMLRLALDIQRDSSVRLNGSIQPGMRHEGLPRRVLSYPSGKYLEFLHDVQTSCQWKLHGSP